MLKKYIVPAVGLGAFIIGGIFAREKALEMVETVQKSLSKTPPVS